MKNRKKTQSTESASTSADKAKLKSELDLQYGPAGELWIYYDERQIGRAINENAGNGSPAVWGQVTRTVYRIAFDEARGEHYLKPREYHTRSRTFKSTQKLLDYFCGKGEWEIFSEETLGK